MAEYIERERARELLIEALNDEWEPAYASDRLNEIPPTDMMPRTPETAIDYLREIGWMQKHDKEISVNVRENVPAHWEINADGYYPYCSHCRQEPPGREMTDFCPCCGADMREAK